VLGDVKSRGDLFRSALFTSPMMSLPLMIVSIVSGVVNSLPEWTPISSS
jgi:hypothetical protein